MYTKEWTIECVTPRDYYDWFTFTVEEVKYKLRQLDRDEPDFTNSRESQFVESFLSAQHALEQHRDFDGELRRAPSVIYDPTTDTEAFIFKLDNNGTTFIVSSSGMMQADESEMEYRVKVFGISE